MSGGKWGDEIEFWVTGWRKVRQNLTLVGGETLSRRIVLEGEKWENTTVVGKTDKSVKRTIRQGVTRCLGEKKKVGGDG